MKQIKQFWYHFSTKLALFKHKVFHILARFPLASFVVLMLVLVGLIALGNQLRKPTPVPVEAVKEPVKVQTYQLGSEPTVQVSAVIEKSGIIKLVAQTAGVVQKIKVVESDHVKRGTVLFSLSTNYQGANAASVAKKMSWKNYEFQLDTYDTQYETIQVSRDIAIKNETQLAELRAISRQSIDETKNLIKLNEEVIGGLDKQIKELEDTNVGGINDATITQLKGTKAQFLGALNGLKSGLRTTEYVSDDSQEPAEISRLLRDNTLRQLDVQERALELSIDLSRLSLKLAQINESLMYPASPCPGTVERIHVKVGQMVTPGTLLATIKGDDNAATAVALIPSEVASQLSRFDSSIALINDQKIAVMPRSISTEPTDGNLHSALFSLPEEISNAVSNGSYITMQLPIGPSMGQGSTVYLPIDAVYYSQKGAYVYLMDTTQNPAVVKNQLVELGSVYGNFVEVRSGLSGKETIILSRSVVEGQAVTR
jgi:multidrug efflux pump subunit AcrA (membrane-fusion protein)